MQNYEIFITKTYYVNVEAETDDEARQKAVEKINDAPGAYYNDINLEITSAWGGDEE